MDDRPLSIAKVTSPILPDICLRQSLFDELDQAASRFRGIWIESPGGSGKTTLAASYIRERHAPCLWYHVDAEDNEMVGFFSHLSLAVTEFSPGCAKSMPQFAPEYLLDVVSFARHYFRTLFASCKGPFVLVFDNCHAVESDSMLFECVRTCLEEMPPGCFALLTSRQPLPPPLLRMRLNRQLAHFGFDSLRMSPDEAWEIASAWEKWRLQRDAVLATNEYVGGWAAGLVLILGNCNPELVGSLTDDDQTRGMLFNYYATELFDRLDEQARESLMYSCFLPSMRPADIDSLTGKPGTGQLLFENHRQLFFIESRTAGERVYQYHPLFSDFLLAKAKETLEPEHFQLIRKQATELLIEKGALHDAAKLYREAGAWEALAGLICKSAPALLEQSRFQTLIKWLEYLPEPMLENVAWLQFWMGTAWTPMRPDRSAEHFRQAYSLFTENGDVPGLILSASGLMETVLNAWDDFHQLDEYVDVLQALLKEGQGKLPVEIESRATATMFGALTYHRPEKALMDYWGQRMQAFDPGAVPPYVLFMSTVYSVLYAIWMGRMDEANRQLEHIRLMASAPRSAYLPYSVCTGMDALFQMIRGEFAESLQGVDAGLQANAENGIRITDPSLLSVGFYASLAMGEYEQGKRYLDKMHVSPVCRSTLHMSHYHNQNSSYFLASGNEEMALDEGLLGLSLAEQAGAVCPVALNHIHLAQVYQQLGRMDEADDQLHRAAIMNETMQSDNLSFSIGMAEAWCLLERGRESAAEALLHTAIPLWKKTGMINNPGWRPEVLSCLCLKALEAGIEVLFVQQVIRKLKLNPSSCASDLEAWPWPVKVYCMGRFELVLNGEAYQPTGKAQQKPLELLKALVAQGGRNVARAKLADMLWPDAEGDQAENALMTTMKRLRKLLGKKRAIAFRQGTLSLNRDYCWVDAWCFERLLGKLDGDISQPQRDAENIVRLTTRAISLYRGGFLQAEDDEFWKLSGSERMRATFIRLLLAAAAYMQEHADADRAVDFYQHALHLDHLDERIYQGLMSCLIGMGNLARAQNVFNQCERKLQLQLGIRPSPETLRIRASIRIDS